jgi:hypothetical protein
MRAQSRVVKVLKNHGPQILGNQIPLRSRLRTKEDNCMVYQPEIPNRGIMLFELLVHFLTICILELMLTNGLKRRRQVLED